ncbi:hypothetical protein TruAng_012087 [Truncatella angustata]|nr:hypothetical protein TruAng_012087 [Truncatella angustata]
MSNPPDSASSGRPALRPALKTEDAHERTPPLKAVQIEEPEQESPEESHPIKQFSAGVGKRLSGRPPISAVNSSRTSLLSQSTLDPSSRLVSHQSPDQGPTDSETSGSHHRHHHLSSRLVSQVAEWLEHERTKKTNRKSRKSRHGRSKADPTDTSEDHAEASSSTAAGSSARTSRHSRSYSIDSQSSDVSLDRLQKIIDDSMSALGLNNVPHYNPKLLGRRMQKKRSLLHLHRTASSDTDYHDGDVIVPKCDAVLDNSKTMSYSGGKTGGIDDNASISNRKEDEERKAWITFKNDIIRIAHTLRIKGWRRVPLEGGDIIDVERLSGALTNAVYVVSPPKDITDKSEPGKKTPAKLLLRVYGPQAEIDRENELNVLRRLARKKIGPRMLGIFENGRFEQFFDAVTLTPADIRDPETSKRIAKRMRELHDGIEVLDEEREAGPNVFRNWDSWYDNVEKRITFLDQKILSGDLGSLKGPANAWKKRGLVCGVEWSKFRETFDKYRQHVEAYYGGLQALKEQLVFGHNDAQYGNILRVRVDNEKSPLLHPQNEHKQLIVIDFEYAAANTRGLEFANHFTEWAYNYHDATRPYGCNATAYPTPAEQKRFLKAYVNHRPQFPHRGSTPNLTPLDSPAETPGTPGMSSYMAGASSSITDFMLDARAPPGGWREDEKRREEQNEKQIQHLMDETRLWRTANSAHWIAWGIMQAKVPGLSKMESIEEPEVAGTQPASLVAPEEEEGEADEFDYLGYAHERALFFWGDCVGLGLAKLEDFPKELQQKIKIVDY